MKLSELIASDAVTLPWPTLVDGAKIGQPQMGESETCIRKCAATPRCGDYSHTGEHTCEFGMSYFVNELHGQRVTLYGLRGPRNNTSLNRYTKGGLKGRSVTKTSIDEWLSNLRQLLNRIEQGFIARQTEMLDPLHDPMRIVKQINTIANRLVLQQSRGVTFDQQLDNAPTELKSLAKAADLLSDSFDLLAIYFNPAAASYGRRGAISVHGLLMKLVASFRIDDGGVTRSSARIFLSGSCYRNAFVYESFKLVPFALLSNAVKYSLIGNIEVTIADRTQHIEVAVESTGPYIEDDERTTIFDKRGRGRWAKKLTDGRGVGLYLAKIIADAHGFEIKFTSRRTGEIRDQIPIAVNRFSFNVPCQL